MKKQAIRFAKFLEWSVIEFSAIITLDVLYVTFKLSANKILKD